MDQYMALSKKDLQIQITLNELYNTHTLVAQHLDLLVSDGADGARIHYCFSAFKPLKRQLLFRLHRHQTTSIISES